jgi:hypothetical protein
MTGLRIASLIVAGVGLVTVAVALVMLQQRLGAIRNFKPVEARVIRAWIEQKKQTADDGSDSISYSANYELAYDFGGQPRRFTARSNDPLLTSADIVQARIARHAPGTRGLVFVNPDNPSDARLNLGRNAVTLGWPLVVLVAGAALMLFAISFWMMGTPGGEW